MSKREVKKKIFEVKNFWMSHTDLAVVFLSQTKLFVSCLLDGNLVWNIYPSTYQNKHLVRQMNWWFRLNLWVERTHKFGLFGRLNYDRNSVPYSYGTNFRLDKIPTNLFVVGLYRLKFRLLSYWYLPMCLSIYDHKIQRINLKVFFRMLGCSKKLESSTLTLASVELVEGCSITILYLSADFKIPRIVSHEQNIYIQTDLFRFCFLLLKDPASVVSYVAYLVYFSSAS